MTFQIWTMPLSLSLPHYNLKIPVIWIQWKTCKSEWEDNWVVEPSVKHEWWLNDLRGISCCQMRFNKIFDKKACSQLLLISLKDQNNENFINFNSVLIK